MLARIRAVSATVSASIAMLACAPAMAALGGDVPSIERDRQAIGGTHAITQTEHYDRHDLETAAGLRVHEFADRSGRVFALSWEGPAQPDLLTLLGSHYSEYTSALQARRIANHHVFSARSGNLTIQIIRRPRGLSGAASIAALIPAGVDPRELH